MLHAKDTLGPSWNARRSTKLCSRCGKTRPSALFALDRNDLLRVFRQPLLPLREVRHGALDAGPERRTTQRT
jgi:hypothetical protein